MRQSVFYFRDQHQHSHSLVRLLHWSTIITIQKKSCEIQPFTIVTHNFTCQKKKSIFFILAEIRNINSLILKRTHFPCGHSFVEQCPFCQWCNKGMKTAICTRICKSHKGWRWINEEREEIAWKNWLVPEKK